MALTKEGQALLDALRDSPERPAILRELCQLIAPPKKETRGRKPNPATTQREFISFINIEKALALMGADRSAGSLRKAAELVAGEVGVKSDMIRRHHRKVWNTLSEEDREGYRRSLREVGH